MNAVCLELVEESKTSVGVGMLMLTMGVSSFIGPFLAGGIVDFVSVHRKEYDPYVVAHLVGCCFIAGSGMVGWVIKCCHNRHIVLNK